MEDVVFLAEKQRSEEYREGRHEGTKEFCTTQRCCRSLQIVRCGRGGASAYIPSSSSDNAVFTFKTAHVECF